MVRAFAVLSQNDYGIEWSLQFAHSSIAQVNSCLVWWMITLIVGIKPSGDQQPPNAVLLNHAGFWAHEIHRITLPGKHFSHKNFKTKTFFRKTRTRCFTLSHDTFRCLTVFRYFTLNRCRQRRNQLRPPAPTSFGRLVGS